MMNKQKSTDKAEHGYAPPPQSWVSNMPSRVTGYYTGKVDLDTGAVDIEPAFQSHRFSMTVFDRRTQGEMYWDLVDKGLIKPAQFNLAYGPDVLKVSKK